MYVLKFQNSLYNDNNIMAQSNFLVKINICKIHTPNIELEFA